MGNQQSGFGPDGTPFRDRKDSNNRSNSENPFKKLPIHSQVARALSTPPLSRPGPNAGAKGSPKDGSSPRPSIKRGAPSPKNHQLTLPVGPPTQLTGTATLTPAHPLFSQLSSQPGSSTASGGASPAPTPTKEKPGPATGGAGARAPASASVYPSETHQQSQSRQRRVSSSMDVEKNQLGAGSDHSDDNGSRPGSAGRRSSMENGAQVVKDVIEVVQHALAKSPHLPRIRRPSMDMSSFLPGRRSRRNSGDSEGPINLRMASPGPPQIPPDEVYISTGEKRDDDIDDLHPHGRVRASTIGNGQVARSRHLAYLARRRKEQLKEYRRLIPTVFRYPGHNVPKSSDAKVFVCGSMTNWQTRIMGRPEGEMDFILIIDCPEGDVYFKFHADNVWKHDPKQQTVKNNAGKMCNTITVERTDNDVFEALACDSFSLKDSRCNTGLENDTDRLQGDSWNQDKPSEELLQLQKSKGPPILPPHLLQILLNKEVGDMGDPVLLPEPSHVSLHHLYAQSIRDKMLVLATTTRYRKKCVTVVLYKPLEP
eukprot:snap_masked-scaffold281_size224178-processed-gene-1.14 protein:Tk10992 transcript:snap_masked-scaffold281_size224178-processed-gene-1.14-mRNA-1 annotation:"5-amp-activated protein kinase subunit beta-1"